ncbi:hypothetical protein CRG98_042433 [Punica granatum]|nr:hypothetical protein CRG98_042433 [Punica granatum]
MRLQKVLNKSQTLFQCTWELPSRAMTPIAAHAPLAESRKPTIPASRMPRTSLILSLGAKAAKHRDTIAYEDAMAFDAMK